MANEERQRICQCCGMPMTEDEVLSRETDGRVNEDYCKWCYAGGKFTYETREALLDFLVEQMPNPEGLSAQERREMFDSYLLQLKHWKA